MMIPDNLNEFMAGVVGTLVAVDQGSRLQRNTVFLDQAVYRVKHKINFQRPAHIIGQ